MKTDNKVPALLNLWRQARVIVCSPGAHLYYWCLGVTLLWRLGLELINQAIVPLMTPGPGDTAGVAALRAGRHGLSRWLDSWDGAWYGTISQHGYVIVNHFKSYESIVFFPLFPYTVRWLSELTHIPYKAIGLVINVLLTSLLVFFLVRFTQLLQKEKGGKYTEENVAGKLAVIFLLLSPSAFFFAAYYAEALLVLLMTASLYFGYRDKFILAALLAGLSTATKSIGLIMLPTLLVMYLSKHYQEGWVQVIKRHWAKIGAIGTLSVSGLVAYMVYLWARFGDPLVFIKTEKYWNRNVTGFFLGNIWHVWYEKLFSPHYFAPMSNYLYSLFLMAIPLVVLFAIVYVAIRHRMQYAWLATMAFFGLLMPLSTGLLISLNRYVLVLTPLISYVCVYIYPQSSWTRRIFWGTVYLSGATLFIFTAAFLSFRFAG